MSHLGDLLSAHLDGELSPAEIERVTDHLYECSPCRTELDDLREIRAAIRALPELDAPIPLLPAARRRPWMTAAASIAAVALAAVMVVTPETVAAPDLDGLAGQHNARAVIDPGLATMQAPVTGR
jgi:predicted anti-sigma-YlaC factor YlaD